MMCEGHMSFEKTYFSYSFNSFMKKINYKKVAKGNYRSMGRYLTNIEDDDQFYRELALNKIHWGYIRKHL
jgi:hypothetical protein